MSNEDLQRATKSVSDNRTSLSASSLPARRNHITPKVRIAGQRTRYLSLHDDEHLADIFLRVTSYRRCGRMRPRAGRHPAASDSPI